jgi:hypothetical protein
MQNMEPFAPTGPEEEAVLLPLGSWEALGVSAGFTTRHAGNCALHTGDDPVAVIRRRERVAQTLGFSLDAWVCGEQVHGNQVAIARRSDAGRGSRSRAAAFPDTDALISDEPDLLLVQFFADCVPLYFFDPVKGAIGLAHAGWKGTVLDIAGRTIAKMAETFGSKPSDMLAAIGPSIGACCYEVGEEVARKVRELAEARSLDVEGSVLTQQNAQQGAEQGVQQGAQQSGGESKARLDLKELNRQLMIKAGILPSRIEMTHWCTGCRKDLFFSYRMERGSSGRMMSWLGRKSR